MLHVHRAERADALVEALGDVLRSPLPDPLQAEVISVPTRGVERWLTQRLSHRLGVTAGAGRSDGVCANVEFPFPGHLVGDAMAAACGVERDTDPWRPERAVWPLLEILDEHLDEPWLATIAAHLGVTPAHVADGGIHRSRRFSTARHIVDLYDRYAVHRPAMVRSWNAGRDVTAAATQLPPDVSWQPELWRRLRGRIGEASPAERLEAACADLTADRALTGLPERLALFGLTRLPASYLDVLRALAAQRDVHLFLLHPSPTLWERVAGGKLPVSAILRRADDPTVELATNPLLRSWGRDSREMQLVLTAGHHPAVDDHRPLVPTDPTTLLHRVQHAVRRDAAPIGEPLPGDGDRRPVLDADDRSLQIHACHGQARQVEVVRDAILHFLVEDPSLEARDVIVMCPDIEAFAPLIHATFGAGAIDGEDMDGIEEEAEEQPVDAHRPADLRVRLADRSLRQTNPVLAAVTALLALADARVTSTEVLDFAGRDPVRRRFRLDDDDLSRIEEWVAATGIRWGLDGPGRAPFKLERIEQNTWRTGLDRVLVGVAMAEEQQRLVGGVLPLDDVDSGAIDLAGRFAELIDRLHTALLSLREPKGIAGWGAALQDAVDNLTATTQRDGWQRTQLQRLLDEMVSEATVETVTSDAELELSELRALLGDRLRGRPTRANFRTGHLTVCTLVPMRSVPHRVVCLLGLDDGAYPRRSEPDGDDLVAAEPFVGDPDGRGEDRQLLLDALLAATDRLVITYSGHDERTNAELAPAVPVGELLDVVDATVRVDGSEGARARDHVVVHHPLQPFDPRNFEPGRLVGDQPWSFDVVTMEGAQALRGDRPPVAPFLVGPLPPPAASDVVELDQLVKFVQHPIRAFLRQRLGISVGDFDEDMRDAIPVELDGLEKWAIGERLLAARLAGASVEACRAVEWSRGELPPEALADRVLADIGATVERLVAEAVSLTAVGAEADSVELSVPLDDGRLLVGTVPGVIGSVVRSVTYSKVAPKHRLAAWLRFLALNAGRPGEAFEVVTLGRARDGAAQSRAVTLSRFGPLADDPSEAKAIARRHLHDQIALYDRGLCEPVPVYCATSAAYAAAAARGRDGTAAAHKAWESGKFPGEEKDLEHLLVLGGVVPLEQLMETPPSAGEDGDGWDTSETSRFGRYARRMWDGLLGAERLEDK